MKSIKRAITKLWIFRGCDSRAQFWPYAAVVAATTAVLSVVVAVPTILAKVQEGLAFAEANPDKASIHRTPTSVWVEIHDPTGMPPLDPLASFWPLILIVVVAGLFLAAAITRRLHDRGLSGRWALIPVGLYAVWLVAFFGLSDRAWGDSDSISAGRFVVMFMGLFVAALVAQISALSLVIVLALKGKTGPNPYGPEPG